MCIPVWTLSPTCKLDIDIDFPFSIETVADEGKHPPPDDDGGGGGVGQLWQQWYEVTPSVLHSPIQSPNSHPESIAWLSFPYPLHPAGSSLVSA